MLWRFTINYQLTEIYQHWIITQLVLFRWLTSRYRDLTIIMYCTCWNCSSSQTVYRLLTKDFHGYHRSLQVNSRIIPSGRPQPTFFQLIINNHPGTKRRHQCKNQISPFCELFCFWQFHTGTNVIESSKSVESKRRQTGNKFTSLVSLQLETGKSVASPEKVAEVYIPCSCTQALHPMNFKKRC
jgi:hypothetical protein